MVSLIVYESSKEILKSEIHRANTALLNETKELIDNELNSVKRLTTELIWNIRVRDLIYSSWYSRNDELYDTYLTTKEMASYQYAYPSVKDYYIYWAKKDIVLLPGVYRSSQLAFDTVHEFDKLSYDLWKGLLTVHDQRRFIKLEHKNGQGSSLAYIYSFDGDTAETPLGASVVLLDTDKLLETISSARSFSGGEVLLIDSSNRVLISTSSVQNEDLYLSDLPFEGESGSFYHEYHGKKSEFMYTKSINGDLTIATVVPSKLFWEKAQYMRNLTLWGLVLSMLSGVALTAILVRKHYNPVRLLTLMLPASAQHAMQWEGNEFQYIQNAISNTLNEKEQIQLRMKRQSYVLRSNLLTRLFLGKGHSQLPLEEAMTTFDIHFISEDFAVILFYLDYASFFERLKGDDFNEKIRLTHFIVTNVVEELVREEHGGYVCETNDYIACLVNFPPMEEQREEQLVLLAERARSFLQENYKINSTIAISSIKSSMVNLPQLYREAMDTLEYMIVVGNQEIHSYSEFHKDRQDTLQTSQYYPIQTEQQLINYLKVGDIEKTRALIHEVISRNVEESRVTSVEFIRSLMFTVAATFIKTINELGDVKESLLIESRENVVKLVTCESIKEMEQQLSVVVQQICEYTGEKQRLRQTTSRNQIVQERTREILSYIECNYINPNLNISMIGDHFRMTPTYLSKIFKENVGNGLLDTINQIRITHAKKILADPRMNIKVVAQECGFHDINTFIRVFKKYEGVTPGQYQKVLQDNDNL
ncbi:AraC family transcriptional regulator [Paenibacillus sinensis]|nr:AraC family transcriptional regulator [Paenibacillus sinensis]